MEKIQIKKIAVLGSGIMGSRIACHLINVGFEVVLLDITPKELNKTELKNNKKLNDLEVRNRIVNESLSNAVHSKPSPLFKKEKHTKIITGNFEDDIKLVSTVDWIIEVVVENLKIKNEIYDLIEKHRRKDTIITTNTSGIPINHISKEGPKILKKCFLGHIFLIHQGICVYWK